MKLEEEDAQDDYEKIMGDAKDKRAADTGTGALSKESGEPVETLAMEFAHRILGCSAKQASSNGFLQQPSGAGECPAFASSGILSILETLAETFEKNLSSAQKDERKAKEHYEVLAAAKEQPIAVAKEKLHAMQAEGAGNNQAIVRSVRQLHAGHSRLERQVREAR